MITLAQSACPLELGPVLRNARERFGKLRAVIYASASGHWDRILPAGPKGALFYFLFEGGRHRFDPEDGDEVDQETGFNLKAAIIRISDAHTPPASGPQLNCAIILRRNAYILMPARLVEPNLYVPLPDTSAHELLADQQQLEADFPNLFRIT